MIESATHLIDEGKKSLETLLRERAYEEVREKLQNEGIAIDDVEEADIEALVAAKVEDMMSGIKGFAVGSAFALVLSAVVGF